MVEGDERVFKVIDDSKRNVKKILIENAVGDLLL